MIWKIWKDLWDLLAYRLINSSRRSRLRECVPHGTEILQIGTNRTNHNK